MFGNKNRKRHCLNLGFDYTHELRKYQYLNGSLGKMRIKKLDNNERFETYDEWERHIVFTLQKKTKEEILELRNFLRYSSRTLKGFDATWNNFIIPFFLAILVNEVIELIKQSSLEAGNVTELLNMCYKTLIESPDFLYIQLITCLLMILALLVQFIPSAFIVGLVCMLSGEIAFFAIKGEEEKAFCEDYQEVINKVLEASK